MFSAAEDKNLKVFQTLFKKFDILELAYKQGTFACLLCKELPIVLEEVTVHREIYFVLYFDHDSEWFLYSDKKANEYNTLLRDCLHEHDYNYERAEAHFTDPERSHITLNVWQHNVFYERPNWDEGTYTLYKGDEGATVDCLMSRLFLPDLTTYALFYKGDVWPLEPADYDEYDEHSRYMLQGPNERTICLAEWDGYVLADSVRPAIEPSRYSCSPKPMTKADVERFKSQEKAIED